MKSPIKGGFVKDIFKQNLIENEITESKRDLYSKFITKKIILKAITKRWGFLNQNEIWNEITPKKRSL